MAVKGVALAGTIETYETDVTLRLVGDAIVGMVRGVHRHDYILVKIHVVIDSNFIQKGISI
ncbi:hypothetical protein CZ794_11755 [Psychrobacter sp. JB385]|nr:hypothetical protein CZ794_11755 [Psychrobacter sp. JB385]